MCRNFILYYYFSWGFRSRCYLDLKRKNKNIFFFFPMTFSWFLLYCFSGDVTRMMMMMIMMRFWWLYPLFFPPYFPIFLFTSLPFPGFARFFPFWVTSGGGKRSRRALSSYTYTYTYTYTIYTSVSVSASVTQQQPYLCIRICICGKGTKKKHHTFRLKIYIYGLVANWFD